MASLPVTRQLLEKSLHEGWRPNTTRLFIVQHLRPDTCAFVKLLREFGVNEIRAVGIDYGSFPEVGSELLHSGVAVSMPDHEDLNHEVSVQFRAALSGSRRGWLIQEVGGYFARLIRDSDIDFASACNGLIEETKNGLWLFQKLRTIPFPIIQIADSELKRVEARYVGSAVVRATTKDLAEIGEAFHETVVGVIGLGDIGSSVAASTAADGDVSPLCYDLDPLRLVDAHARGYSTATKAKVLESAGIIVGATGSRSLSYEELPMCQDNVILASASSKNVEFPVEEIRRKSLSCDHVSRSIAQFAMSWGKRVRVINGGYPVNFRNDSLPIHVADLLFCQLAASMATIASSPLENGIHCLPFETQREIASMWLQEYCELL